MLLVSNCKLNYKYKSLLWFADIFYTTNYILFYRYDRTKYINSLEKIVNLYNNNLINYKIFNYNRHIKNLHYFSFLKGNTIVIYTNNFSVISDLIINNIYLYAICYSGYFLNPLYFSNIVDYQLFYSNNYLFINIYLTWFIIIFNIFVEIMVSSIISQIFLIFITF